MNESPFFSIIIPCYNCQESIGIAIDSVVNQPVNSYEIILVDDCSTDNTHNILQTLADSNNNIRVFRNKNNLGPGGSRNVGLIHAHGQYVCFLDSDDRFAEGFLSSLQTHIKSTCSDLVFFDFKRCFPNGGFQFFTLTDVFTSSSSKKDYIALSGESVCMLAAKRDLFSKVEFSPTFLAEDVVMVPVLCSLSSFPTSLHDIGYLYTFTEGSLSHLTNRRMLESIIICSQLLDKYIASSEYQQEFIFRKIRLICYNYVYVALRQGIPLREIDDTVVSLMENCPDWGNNPYIRLLPLRKKLFVNSVWHKQFHITKLYVKMQELFFLLKGKIKF